MTVYVFSIYVLSVFLLFCSVFVDARSFVWSWLSSPEDLYQILNKKINSIVLNGNKYLK